MLCTSSTGTFFIGLGVDLSLNQQKGMSRGLRLLFDQNTSHVAVSLHPVRLHELVYENHFSAGHTLQ